ncbi:MAG: 2Fe-2S iron-sulfur cluster binding domain-containing protein [Gammaproteobacteria bacterium]|nr:2Fe-2S iron-sulfur cluster binding domain-containing protein [Gammaproteobacteria bacterium]
MAYQVNIEPVGKSFKAEADASVLESAFKAGITLKHSCRDGQCGECRAPIKSGAVRYADPDALSLADSDKAGETGLMCQALPTGDLTIEAPEVTELDGISVQKFAGRVMGKEQVSDDVAVLKIGPAPGVEFRFKPGQYVDLTLRGHPSRSYSMSSLDSDNTIELQVRRMQDGYVSHFIYDELATKAVVTLEGPFGTFYVRDSDSPIVFTASGTGFAPIMGMMRDLIERGNQRPVVLYWGGRRLKDLYEDALCREWADTLDWFSYVPVLSEAAEADQWSGRTGFVHQAVVDDREDLSDVEAYVCGAPVVVEAARRDFIGLRGLKPEHFFSDAFV